MNNNSLEQLMEKLKPYMVPLGVVMSVISATETSLPFVNFGQTEWLLAAIVCVLIGINKK